MKWIVQPKQHTSNSCNGLISITVFLRIFVAFLTSIAASLALALGMRRRCQLLECLATPRSVYLMDEITSDLDLFAREGILNFLRAETETRGATIFYCSLVTCTSICSIEIPTFFLGGFLDTNSLRMPPNASVQMTKNIYKHSDRSEAHTSSIILKDGQATSYTCHRVRCEQKMERQNYEDDAVENSWELRDYD